MQKSLIRIFQSKCLSPWMAADQVSQKRGIQTPPGVNAICPLLQDKVSTFNMEAHLVQLNMKSTAIINPTQTPVNISDQPVYALTKKLQFRHPDIFSQYFPIFGQLPIEKSLLITHGHLIEGSGLP